MKYCIVFDMHTLLSFNTQHAISSQDSIRKYQQLWDLDHFFRDQIELEQQLINLCNRKTHKNVKLTVRELL